MAVLAFGLSAGLAACGGGGGDSSSTATSAVSSSTSTTVNGGTNPTSTSTAAVMPLEVMGSNGATVTVTVSAPTGASASKLYMQINNLAYDGEGSIQINNGAWIALTNSSVSIQGAGASYGGIGGGFDTLKMTVPISSAQNGTNTIRFRFNSTDGVSSGFRVLALDLQNSAGTSVMAANQTSQDDPKTWVAPLNNAADIAAGKTLWQSATLVESPLNTGTSLQAHCMDCHTANGSDLQRFNYSNYSIEERAAFHGLNATQGAQIASYIRSLSASLGVPGDLCRPWNPPYQPGPGLDSGDVKNWTCGAGLGAVSDSDADTLTAIFPNGINAATIATKGQLNAREIPISLQLPDWNHWIPRVHPKDAWGSTFTNSNLNKEYAGEGTGSGTYNMRTQLSTLGTAYAQQNLSGHDFFTDLYYWGVALGEQFTPITSLTGANETVAQQVDVYSTAQWQLVKFWELAQDFNLETNCPVAWKNEGGTKIEGRSWCGYWRFIFNVSPHILGFPADNNMFGSPVAMYAKSNQWYELQLLLNPGSGAHNVHLPLDWQYAIGLITDLGNASGRMEPARNLLYVVKGAQEADNGVGVGNVDRGWTARSSSPFDVWKSGQSGIWKGTALATEQAVVNAYTQNWVTTSQTFDLNVWQRVGGASTNGETTCGWANYELCASDYVPNTLSGGTTVNFPSNGYNEIPQMRAEGINGTVLNNFLTWLNAAYPSGNFNALKQ